MHTCANCHSFSRDGKTLGMDLDGPQNDKGMYAMVPVSRRCRSATQDVISWSSFRGQAPATSRVGFMSQVSPDGQYVVTTIERRGMTEGTAQQLLRGQFQGLPLPAGVLSDARHPGLVRPRDAAQLQPLPGADDPRYVQTNAVWSPDGKYLVFARAEAQGPLSAGPEAGRATPTIRTRPRSSTTSTGFPSTDGKGGEPEPIAGASHNGMSNSFPKVSPDGRWIVFVQCRNGQLMRPDSQLYIVPAAGGAARRMRCNTAADELLAQLLAQRPLAGVFLQEPLALHADVSDAPGREGNDSPAILIDNSTAANRAVNIPEFVNIPPDGMMKIDVPAAEFYRLYDIASALTRRGELEPAIAAWKKVLELDPANAQAHLNLGVALQVQGDLADGARHLQQAQLLDPGIGENQSEYGAAYFDREQFRAAVRDSACSDVMTYGTKLLAAAPDDEEAVKAVAACEEEQDRQHMRDALARSDYSTALALARKILAVDRDDKEAQETVRTCQPHAGEPLSQLTRPRPAGPAAAALGGEEDETQIDTS